MKAPQASKPQPSPAPPLPHETADAYSKRTGYVFDPGEPRYWDTGAPVAGVRGVRTWRGDGRPKRYSITMGGEPAQNPDYSQLRVNGYNQVVPCCSDNAPEARYCRHCGKRIVSPQTMARLQHTYPGEHTAEHWSGLLATLEGLQRAPTGLVMSLEDGRTLTTSDGPCTFTRTNYAIAQPGAALSSYVPKIGSRYPGIPEDQPPLRVVRTQATPCGDNLVKLDITYSGSDPDPEVQDDSRSPWVTMAYLSAVVVGTAIVALGAAALLGAL